MARTQVGTKQILDGGVCRADLNVTVVGQAVIRKAVQGMGISLFSTGVDAGTGDVTISLATTINTGAVGETFQCMNVSLVRFETDPTNIGSIGSAYFEVNHNTPSANPDVAMHLMHNGASKWEFASVDLDGTGGPMLGIYDRTNNRYRIYLRGDYAYGGVNVSPTDNPDKEWIIKGMMDEYPASRLSFWIDGYDNKGHFALWDGSTLQLAINRSIEGNFADPSSCAASMNICGVDGNSWIDFYTGIANGTDPTLRAHLDGTGLTVSGNVTVGANGGTLNWDGTYLSALCQVKLGYAGVRNGLLTFAPQTGTNPLFHITNANDAVLRISTGATAGSTPLVNIATAGLSYLSPAGTDTLLSATCSTWAAGRSSSLQLGTLSAANYYMKATYGGGMTIHSSEGINITVGANITLTPQSGSTVIVYDAGASANGIVLDPGNRMIVVSGTQVVGSRKTGWTAWTGTAARTGQDTSKATVTNCAQAIKALVDDLLAHGLIGA